MHHHPRPLLPGCAHSAQRGSVPQQHTVQAHSTQARRYGRARHKASKNAPELHNSALRGPGRKSALRPLFCHSRVASWRTRAPRVGGVPRRMPSPNGRSARSARLIVRSRARCVCEEWASRVLPEQRPLSFVCPNIPQRLQCASLSSGPEEAAESKSGIASRRRASSSPNRTALGRATSSHMPASPHSTVLRCCQRPHASSAASESKWRSVAGASRPGTHTHTHTNQSARMHHG